MQIKKLDRGRIDRSLIAEGHTVGRIAAESPGYGCRGRGLGLTAHRPDRGAAHLGGVAEGL